MGLTVTITDIANDAVIRRLYARGSWLLESPGHFGGDETGIADMCLLRDINGLPFIPAASIAGAARSFLAKCSLPWVQYRKGINQEPPELKRLFGGADEKDGMSALIVSDAVCERAVTTTRDGVRIRYETGSAAYGAKFDVEVVERGTEFDLNFQCIIRHGDQKGNSCSLEKWFLALLQGFQEGDIRLGARTRRGYGRGRVQVWDIRDLRMDKPADVMAWLTDTVWSRPASSLLPGPTPTDQRQYFCIQADFALQTSLLIRSVSSQPQSPDMVHMHSAQQPVVPGTSFGGAFRHRADLIATTIGWPKNAVEDMFGPVHDQQARDAYKDLFASRVFIEEQLVDNVQLHRQQRVAIDRFTGGSLSGALFDEEPVFPQKGSASHLTLTLTLEEPDDAEIGLLLLTLRDFWNGHATLGGETSNGRGTLQGVKANLRLQRADELELWEIRHVDRRMHIEGDVNRIHGFVTQAQNHPSNLSGSRRPINKERN